MSPVTDWRGTPIEVGSKVVYVPRCGGGKMVEAEVVEIGEPRFRDTYKWVDGERVLVPNGTELPRKVTVQPLREPPGWSWTPGLKGDRSKSRKMTFDLDQILVLP